MTTNPEESQASHINKTALAKRLDPSGNAITPHTIMGWYRSRKIPGMRLGYRTVLFDETKVRAALEKFTVREVA